ncbi:MAG: Hint domain-containing protein [Cognatishimia sp.]|uniref:Hint domain-containing protein n=1 Tax=Cognatishimia sp. TaxID=2211648 RepID=UPI003B8BA422
MPDPYVSEVKFLGAGNQDFIEIALDAGSDPSNVEIVIYHPNGSVRTTNALGSLDNTMAGKDVYSIDAGNTATFNGVHKNGAVAVVENGVVVQFISFENTVTANNGPAAGMSSTELGGTGQGESLESSNGGSSYTVNTAPSQGTIPCFLEGTRIQAEHGDIAIEQLKPGDLVQTQDDGLCKVQWVGMRQLTLEESSDPRSRPIRIPAYAFGAARPVRDLMVSPNHRIVVSGPLVASLFDCPEVLVAAKFLEGFEGIGACPTALPIRFHHLLMDAHHIVTSNGLASETLFLGDLSEEAFSTEQVQSSCDLEVFEHHTHLARRALKAREAELLVQELKKQKTFHLLVS